MHTFFRCYRGYLRISTIGKFDGIIQLHAHCSFFICHIFGRSEEETIIQGCHFMINGRIIWTLRGIRNAIHIRRCVRITNILAWIRSQIHLIIHGLRTTINSNYGFTTIFTVQANSAIFAVRARCCIRIYFFTDGHQIFRIVAVFAIGHLNGIEVF